MKRLESRATVHGDRVRQVRMLRHLTQKELAALAHIKQNTLSQIESGLVQPSEEVANAIAVATDFPVMFFATPPGPQFPMGSLVFRARSTITKTSISEAHAWAELEYECAMGLAMHLSVRPPSLPNLKDETPSQAARIARSILNLSPDSPIPNLIHTVEQRGIFVLGLPVELPGRDAFSAWAGTNPNYPIIIVPSSPLGGRLRFTIAHELYHVFVPDYRGSSRSIENDADEFAAELLMPDSGIRSELRSPVTLSKLIPLCVRWGVSPQALVTRAFHLGHISERRCQQLFKELSARGYARKEPPAATIPLERPRIFRRMAELVYGVPVNPRKLAAEFNLPMLLASSILSAHAERHELLSSVPIRQPDNVIAFKPPIDNL